MPVLLSLLGELLLRLAFVQALPCRVSAVIAGKLFCFSKDCWQLTGMAKKAGLGSLAGLLEVG